MHDAKQSNWWQLIKLPGGRWAELDGDQRAAAFAYYLLLSLLPLTILLVTAGSLFVEREVTTQAVVKSVNHYTPLTNEQERTAVANIREWLQARGGFPTGHPHHHARREAGWDARRSGGRKTSSHWAVRRTQCRVHQSGRGVAERGWSP